MFYTSSNSGSMEIDKESEIVKRGLWDHYSGLPNPLWYEHDDKTEDE